ncbi:MAG: cation diffusion facilitator family transporter [Candidatus Margulisbacteria bacterium]|nr:cation diffusion facilitator family transporter [Candidatus Margulisiibacteriota bacterium]
MHEHKHPTAKPFGDNARALIIALAITLLMMLVECVGGLMSGSLALLSDAGHMLTDTGALALALFALWFSQRPATTEKTYGFYRVEILAALLNGAGLIAIAGFIFYEAVKRLFLPIAVQGPLMLAVATVGLAANLLGAFILSKGSRGNLNVRAALWHMLSDALSSVGVILGGLVIILTGATAVDPIISFVIGLVILRGAWLLIKESVDILLEATPKDISHAEVEKGLKQVAGVLDIHDLHIWTIASGRHALSAHVLVADTMVRQCGAVSKELKNILREKFDIDHATLEFECKSCPEGLICKIEK